MPRWTGMRLPGRDKRSCSTWVLDICSRIVAKLRGAGGAADLPAAVIERATLPGQRTLRGTLQTIVNVAQAAEVAPPALLVVGEVTALGAADTSIGSQLAAIAAASGGWSDRNEHCRGGGMANRATADGFRGLCRQHAAHQAARSQRLRPAARSSAKPSS